MRHSNIWIVTCWCEHREGLNIRNVFLPRKSMRANDVSKCVKYEIRILTGFIGLLPNIGPNLNCMVHQLLEQFDEIVSSVIQAAA